MGARSRWGCASCGRNLGTLERMPRGVDGLRLGRAVEDCFFSEGALTVLCPRCDAPTSYAQTWAQTSYAQTWAQTVLCSRCDAQTSMGVG